MLIKYDSPQEVVAKANFCVAKVTRAINGLGLEVAASTTEAMLFSKNKISTESLAISISGQSVPIRKSIKYLGVIIDGTWNFRNHFQYMEGKASGVI